MSERVMDAQEAADARWRAREALIAEQEVAQKRKREQELEKLTGFKPIPYDPGFIRRVVIQVAKRATTEGGIQLPETMKQRPTTGLVVAVSEGTYPGLVKVGDRVLFMRYAGIDIELPSGETLEEHKVCRENECFGYWPS